MEKIKLERVEHEPEIKTCKILGQDVKIKTQLTYEEQEACATEYVELCCVIDEAKHVAYIGFNERYAVAYVYAKYYTNIDEADFIDMAYDTTLINEVIFAISNNAKDEYETYALMRDYAARTVEIYDKYNSLGSKVVNAFGGVLDGTDLTEIISHNGELNDLLIDVMAAKDKKETEQAKITQFAQFAKKK